MNKKGFTLVELSIVLVIIGLLIGGILAAQSMINTTKIQTLIRQVSQFDVAVSNFQTKYNQLPGDDNLMGVTKGNNDGKITDVNGADTSAAFQGEIGKFWYDLSLSGLVSAKGGGYPDNSSVAITPVIGVDIPKSPIGTNAGIVGFYQNATIQLGNYYAVGGIGGTPTAVNLTGALKPIDAKAIDLKMDEGTATYGKVYGVSSNIGSFSLISSGTCLNSYTNNYDLALNSDICVLKIRIGATLDDLK